MRMTRAALRAQAQAEENTEPEDFREKEKDSRRQPYTPAQIHEDAAEVEAADKPETDPCPPDDPPVRQALRDITDENYPQADGIVEVHSKLEQSYTLEEDSQELQRSTRKGRGKTKGRTKKKVDGPTVVEPEARENENQEQITPVADQQKQESQNGLALDEIAPQKQSDQRNEFIAEEDSIFADDLVSEPGPAIEEPFLEPQTVGSFERTTPRFDPAVHIPDDTNAASATEDSFLQSIRSRSPAKTYLSDFSQLQRSDSFNSSLQAHTPLRRTSSTNFEESFEAMDSLEDTIEQLTAGLPIMQAEEMHSPESPLKPNKQSLQSHLDSAASNDFASTKTPKSASKLQAVLRLQEKDKENTPPVTKTPTSKVGAAVKSKTPARQATPLRTRTPATKSTSPTKGVPSSRKITTKSQQELAAMQPEPTPRAGKSIRKSVVIVNGSTANNQAIENKKPAAAIQRKPSQKQPLTSTTIKSEVLPKKPTVQAEKKFHQTSMSFSNSPAKQQTALHKRRITSGAILSTSKPGFVPTKSTKQPTTSNFALPGEAVAEKLKAQKEAREEKMKQPKVNLAEQKAAKLKADREARQERVRLNQLRAKEVEAEKSKPARPLSTSVLTVSKARAEAAERGRQASKEWAEKMLKKKQVGMEASGAAANAITAS